MSVLNKGTYQGEVFQFSKLSYKFGPVHIEPYRSKWNFKEVVMDIDLI
jgi:hypothetical protein